MAEEPSAGAAEAAAETQAEGPPPPQPDKPIERIVVVSAHPDDPDFTAAATVAKYARQGAHVVYVICSDGSQGGEDPAVPDEELVVLRQKEQRAAADVLGVAEVVFLGYHDGYLYPTPELRRDISRQIRKYRPDVVITHAPFRNTRIPIGASHPDHIAVGEAAFAAVYPDARNPRAYRELLAEGLEAFKVRQVWHGSLSEPDHFEEVTEDLLQLKMQALMCHQSQFAMDPNSEITLEQRFEWMRERMRQAGEMAGYQYAEAFNRTVIDY